jgi:iron complex transport system permease protein
MKQGKIIETPSGMWRLLLLALILLTTAIFSFGIGRYSLSAGEILRYIFLNDYADDNIPILITQVRMPRILGAILAGGALAVSGAAYQGLFRNPMVSPDILGISSGAGFGAAIAIVFSMGIAGIQSMAFLSGLLAVSLSLFLSRMMANYDKILVLVLSGMIVGSLFSALLSLMKYVADSESKLPDITFWLMGSLSALTMKELKIIFPVVACALLPMFLSSWKLNILSFGDEEAQTLGLNTRRLRILIICSASLLTASVVSVTGLIGWVGLIIPHFTRFLVGPNHKVLLPASFLTGAAFMLLVDDLSRSVSTLEIPLGIITAMIGAPLFFIVLKVTSKRVW